MSNTSLMTNFELDRRVTKNIFSDLSTRYLTFKRCMINATYFLNDRLKTKRRIYLVDNIIFTFNINMDDYVVEFLLDGKVFFIYNIETNILENNSKDVVRSMRDDIEINISSHISARKEVNSDIRNIRDKMNIISSKLVQYEDDCMQFKFLGILEKTPYIRNKRESLKLLSEILGDYQASLEKHNDSEIELYRLLEFINDDTFKLSAEYLANEIRKYSGERVIVHG